MPHKLSDIGKMHAHARAAGGVRDPVMGTPAAQILGEPAGPADPDTPEPFVVLTTSPEPLPEPASETELDQLDYLRRAALFELHQDQERLAALAQARDRAREEWRTANRTVEQAQETLRAARLHSRGDLVAAYVNHQPTDFVMTESAAQGELDSCTARLRHVEEIGEALRAEIASIEDGLPQRHHDIATAAGKLVSRTPQFLNLIERIYTAYRELRDCRLVIDELSHLVNLDDDLRRLADNNQPSTGHRFGGYLNDEEVVTDWTNAITRLLADADAPLPGPAGSAGSNSSNSSPASDCGAAHRPASRRRRRAQGAAPPLSRRPAQHQRASGKPAGMPVRRRASLARERDAGGRFTRKAGENAPPPQ